jgi:hypothetical protein
MAALAVAFLLLVLLAQVTFALTARHAAETAVAASARRAARPGADLAMERAALEDILAATVPGGTAFVVDLSRAEGTVIASAVFDWTPPGPVFGSLAIRVSATSLQVVPP